jgi:hypothetical protein
MLTILLSNNEVNITTLKSITLKIVTTVVKINYRL